MSEEDLLRTPRIIISETWPGIKKGGAAVQRNDPTREALVILRINFKTKVYKSPISGGNVIGTFFHEAGHFLQYNNRLSAAKSGTSMLKWWDQYKYCPICKTKGPNEAPAEFYRKLMEGGGSIKTNYNKKIIPKPSIVENLMKQINNFRIKIGAKPF